MAKVSIGPIACKTMSEVDSDGDIYFSTKIEVHNSTETIIDINITVQALDKDGFQLRDGMLSGRILASTTKSLTDRTFMKQSHYVEIHEWRVKEVGIDPEEEWEVLDPPSAHDRKTQKPIDSQRARYKDPNETKSPRSSRRVNPPEERTTPKTPGLPSATTKLKPTSAATPKQRNLETALKDFHELLAATVAAAANPKSRQPSPTESRTDAVIGLDFGTACTKVIQREQGS